MATSNAKSGNPAKRGTPMRPPIEPVTARDWVAAARPRTLPMAIAPVAAGTGLAYNYAGYHLGIALACLALALLLQIGVNFANDYSDGVRGTDRFREGPARLTGSGRAKATTVRAVALAFLGLGAIAGIVVVMLSGKWLLLIVGAAALAAAWLYTGGKRPYGYFGLGELFAFVFFGPVPVLGTMYAMTGEMSEDAVIVSCAVGSLAAAAMLVNNIRDIEQDKIAGKRTIATLIGARAAKVLYAVLMLAPFAVASVYALGLAYGTYVLMVLMLALPAVVIVAMGRTTRDYVMALTLTGLTSLAFGVLTAMAFIGGIGGFGAVA